MKLALAVWAFCLLAIGDAASAQVGPQQCNSFGQMKDDAEKKALAVRTAIQHKSERKEICMLVQRFYAAEGVMLKFLESNKTLCNIPEQAISNAEAGHEHTLKFQTAACAGAVDTLNGHQLPVGTSPTVGTGGHDSSASLAVPMQIEGGIYVVPVLINNAITLDFVVDSGATDVTIPTDVVMTLMRTGTLKKSDFLGEKTYLLADGSTVPSQTFRIRSLKVGNKVLENVIGSIASVKGSLLLGQSFLSRFKSWSVDNAKHALLLSE
jgi:predicted aspartyl protease